NTGLVYDQKKGTVTLKKDDEKITFMMPYKMIDFKKIYTDSIPPSVLESNDDRRKTYYSDSLTLGPEYREDKSISKEIRHLLKLERESKKRRSHVRTCDFESSYKTRKIKKSASWEATQYLLFPH
ncbi:hypothetical protein Tco_0614991, partial [Tanacetum coccineum]